MPDVHCAYRYKGGPCSVPPQDVRLIVLGNGDQLEVLLCTQHWLAVGVLQWADTQRDFRVDL